MLSQAWRKLPPALINSPIYHSSIVKHVQVCRTSTLICITCKRAFQKNGLLILFFSLIAGGGNKSTDAGRLLWAKAITVQISLNASLFSSSTLSVQVGEKTTGCLASVSTCQKTCTGAARSCHACALLWHCPCRLDVLPLLHEPAGLPGPCPLHRGPFLSCCVGNLLWLVDKSQ